MSLFAFSLYLVKLLEQEPFSLNEDKGGFHDHWKIHSNFTLFPCIAILAIDMIEYEIGSLKLSDDDSTLSVTGQLL